MSSTAGRRAGAGQDDPPGLLEAVTCSPSARPGRPSGTPRRYRAPAPASARSSRSDWRRRDPSGCVGEVGDEREGLAPAASAWFRSVPEGLASAVAPCGDKGLLRRHAVQHRGVHQRRKCRLNGLDGPARRSSTTCSSGGRRQLQRGSATASAAGCSTGRSPAPGSLAGRTALVTGPTSGLGRVTARGAAALGARVVLVGPQTRTPGGSRTLSAEPRTARSAPVPVRRGRHGLARLRPRRGRARSWRRSRAWTSLVDNAGRHLPRAHAARRHRGHLRAHGRRPVRPRLGAAAAAPAIRRRRGSSASPPAGCTPRRLDLDDLEWASPGRTRPASTRGRSASRWPSSASGRAACAGSAMTFNAMHPGWADTPGLAEALPGFYRVMGPLLRTPEPRAPTRSCGWRRRPVRRAAAGGRLYLDRRPGRSTACRGRASELPSVVSCGPRSCGARAGSTRPRLSSTRSGDPEGPRRAPRSDRSPRSRAGCRAEVRSEALVERREAPRHPLQQRREVDGRRLVDEVDRVRASAAARAGAAAARGELDERRRARDDRAAEAGGAKGPRR